MVRLSAMASGAIGVASGMVPFAFNPINPVTALKGASVALGVGITTYEIWRKYGQDYLAGRITKVIDDAFQAQPIARMSAAKKIKKTWFPSLEFIEKSIESVVEKHVTNFVVNSKLVGQILDDLDRQTPCADNLVEKKFSKFITAYILTNKCKGIFSPLRPVLSKSLEQIVTTVTADFFKRIATDICSELENSSIGQVVKEGEKIGERELRSMIGEVRHFLSLKQIPQG